MRISLFVHAVLASVAMLVMTGCGTNWNAQAGKYSYAQVMKKMGGLPTSKYKLHNGDLEAAWCTEVYVRWTEIGSGGRNRGTNDFSLCNVFVFGRDQLLKSHSLVRDNDMPFFYGAAREGDTATVKRLLDRYADIVNDAGEHQTALLAAIKGRHGETASLLAARGANLDARDARGDTPLTVAIRTGQPELAGLLVSKGAKVNLSGAMDDTPLHVSLYKGDEATSLLLRSKGAFEDAFNRHGLKPAEMRGLAEVEAMVAEAAQLLSSNGDWSDGSKAKILFERLKAREGRHLLYSCELEMVRRPERRLQGFLLAIKLGVPGSEDKLVSLFRLYGEAQEAAAFLLSGSGKLAVAATEWAARRGHILRFAGSQPPSWGHF